MASEGPEWLTRAAPDPGRAARELVAAAYYLRRGCRPCAERHFDLARRHGATDAQIQAVVAAAAGLVESG